MRFIALSWLGLLTVSLLAVGMVVIKPALAQVDATSTETVATSPDATPTGDLSPSSVETQSPQAAIDLTSASEQDTGPDPSETASGTSADGGSASPTETIVDSTAAAETPPQGLAEVNIIGTKYVDYFTDGVQIYPFPGDPEIHAHIAEPNAPIPTHEGMTWVHSSGSYLYDTASGDLEEGQYAVQSNGSYIEKHPPFVSSTSTPTVLDESTTASVTSQDNSSRPTTTTNSETAATTTAGQ